MKVKELLMIILIVSSIKTHDSKKLGFKYDENKLSVYVPQDGIYLTCKFTIDNPQDPDNDSKKADSVDSYTITPQVLSKVTYVHSGDKTFDIDINENNTYKFGDM